MDGTHSRRRFLRTAVVTAGALGLAGCSSNGGGDGGGTGNGGGNGGGGGNTVKMNDDLKYVPKTIEVPAGTTVTWKNVGNIGHSVTAYEDKIPDGADYWASGGADSEQAARNNYPSKGEIAGGETWKHTFETKGTHKYFCIPHENANMVGTVEVK